MTIKQLRRLVEKLDRRTRAGADEQLTDFLVQAYPTLRTQVN